MKSINNFIYERLKITKDSKIYQYKEYDFKSLYIDYLDITINYLDEEPDENKETYVYFTASKDYSLKHYDPIYVFISELQEKNCCNKDNLRDLAWEICKKLYKEIKSATVWAWDDEKKHFCPFAAECVDSYLDRWEPHLLHRKNNPFM